MDITTLEAEEKAFEKLMDEVFCAYAEEVSAIKKELEEDPSFSVPEDLHARCIAFINSFFSE